MRCPLNDVDTDLPIMRDAPTLHRSAVYVQHPYQNHTNNGTDRRGHMTECLAETA